MSKRTTLLGAVAILAGAGLFLSFQNEPVEAQDPMSNAPVVIVDVSGATLLGPVHRHLAVYSSGRVSYCAIDSQGGLRELQVPVARSIAIDPVQVQAFAMGLERMGAWSLDDQKVMATDVPLVTVTVLQGEGAAKGHTFSYWIPTDGYHGVDTAIQNFVASVLPTEPW